MLASQTPGSMPTSGVRLACSWTLGRRQLPGVLRGIESDPPSEDAERLLGEALGLSPAEAQVALMIAAGLPRADVARRRHVRPETVNDQLKSIFRKAHVRREADMVALVRQLAG